MGRFNTSAATATDPTATVNLAGGVAYAETPELELASVVLTSLVQDKFYEKVPEQLARIRALIAKVDPYFVAQLAVFARKTYGLRSISHVLAGELGARVSGSLWGTAFYREVIRRPDDITEILAYWKGLGNRRPTKAMQKGLGAAFSNWGPYQIAKYRGDDRGVKLVDAVNILHPKPRTERTGAALKGLVDGVLRSESTWEAKLSAAGKDPTAKSNAWLSLLMNEDLGYMALLKNLRSIVKDAPLAIPLACVKLTKEEAIRGSLVLPFRFITAYRELQAYPNASPIIAALSDACEIALSNVPQIPGRTVICLDDSGSMKGKPFDLAAPFAVALVKRLGADLLMFNTTARWKTLNPRDSIFACVEQLNSAFVGAGTDFSAPFVPLNGALYYDRIIYLSDEQGWQSDPRNVLASYRKTHNAEVKIHSFDLQGYGTLQFPQKDVYAYAGFSDRVFDIMGLVEEDRDALVNRIKDVHFDVLA